MTIKSKAAKVLRDPTATADEKSLAGYVLSDADNQRVSEVHTARSLEDLKALLEKAKGNEGQTERVAEIERQIRGME